MIRVIGPKLIAILVLLVGLNASLLGMWYFWTTPLKEQAKIDLSVINSEISKLRADIANIKEEIKYYDENKEKFDKLADAGYMTDQTRFTIAKKLDEIRRESRIQELEYDISDNTSVEHKLAQKAKYQLVKRKIELKSIKSFFDTDIYKFIYLLNNNFPGYSRIISVDLTRKPLDEFDAIIEKISEKEKEYLMNTNIVLEWYALLKLPEEEKLPTRPK